MSSAGAGGLSDRAFRKIVDAIGIPVLVMSADGAIKYIGGSTERDFGRDPIESLGHNVLEYLPPDEVEEAITTIGDLKEHERIGIGVPTVYTIVRPDGSSTRQAIGAVPMHDDPDVAGVVLYFMSWDAHLHLDESLAGLLAGDPLEDVLDRLAQAVAVSLEGIGASIHHDWQHDRFAGTAAWNVPADCLVASHGPWVRAAEAGKPIYAAVDELPERAAAAAEAAGIRGVWSIPVPGEDHSPAVLTVWRSVYSDPVTAHDFVVQRCLRYVQLTLVRAAEHAQLAHLATHDGLTDAANRVLFLERLADALTGVGPVTLLYCDLDRFKVVNDTIGHEVGSEVLVEVAHRMRSVLRPKDLLARYGGDEFTVLLQADAARAEAVAARLIEAIEAPIDTSGPTVSVGLSIGMTTSRTDDTSDTIIRRADAALYEAKAAGGGVIRSAD